jgi:uncharacterized membrane protein
MERLLVIAFEDEPSAYEGFAGLRALHRRHAIAMRACGVVVERDDGALCVRHFDGRMPGGGERFVTAALRARTPKQQAAVIAHVDEHATASVDAQMQALGGTVLRATLARTDCANVPRSGKLCGRSNRA